MAENKLPDIPEPARPTMSELKKQSVMERLWLNYYNDALYAQGLITEEERNRMRVRIRTRASFLER